MATGVLSPRLAGFPQTLLLHRLRWISRNFTAAPTDRGCLVAAAADCLDDGGADVAACQQLSAHRRVLRTWRRYSHGAYNAVEKDLRRKIGRDVDVAASKKLETDLGGIGADTGVMPDFSDPGALNGYALGHFGRPRLLGDLLVQGRPDWLRARVDELFRRNCGRAEQCRVASLGGGPGYDFLSLSALSEFQRGVNVRATVFEYEPCWGTIVSQMEQATQIVLGTKRHSCNFESCDITLPLDAEMNSHVAKGVPLVDLFVCSYCVAENAVRLCEREFVFFHHLFSEASVGALFVFTEVTHRLWPDLADVASNAGLRVAFPHLTGSGKVGWQMVLLKDRGLSDAQLMNVADRLLYDKFKRHDEAHKARQTKGWKRHERKIRGAKQ